MEQEGPDNIVLQMHNYLKYGRRGETDVSDRRKKLRQFSSSKELILQSKKK